MYVGLETSNLIRLITPRFLSSSGGFPRMRVARKSENMYLQAALIHGKPTEETRFMLGKYLTKLTSAIFPTTSVNRYGWSGYMAQVGW